MTTEPRQLLLLLTWMSPAFPTGAFAYSHGLEWAIDTGVVRNARRAEGVDRRSPHAGSGWNDAVLFARCWEEDASRAQRRWRWRSPPRASAIWKRRSSAAPSASPRASSRHRALADEEIAYPVAAGTACAAMGIDKRACAARLSAGLRGSSHLRRGAPRAARADGGPRSVARPRTRHRRDGSARRRGQPR